MNIREKIESFVVKHPGLSAFMVLFILVVLIIYLYFYYRQPKVVKVTESHQVTQAQKAKTSTGETAITEHTTQSTTSGKIQKTVVNRVITIYEPSTGKVAQTITETSDTTTQEGTRQNSETSSEVASKSSESETEQASTDTTTTEKAVVIDGGRNVSSRLGVAGNTNGRPMLTYDLVRVGRYTASATAEVDLNKHTLPAAGAALNGDLGKTDRYFAGVGAQYVFDEKKIQPEAHIGMRF